MLEGIEERNDMERKCGYREEKGLYLVLDSYSGRPCGKLPLELDLCPTCGAGIKFSRGWTWVDSNALFPEPGCQLDAISCSICPMNMKDLGKVGLLWIGEKNYKTPKIWMDEAKKQGISRRISGVPRDFVPNSTWVLLAHMKCIPFTNEEGKEDFKPGIFQVFKPSGVEYITDGTESQEEINAIIQRGITPVKVNKIEKEEIEMEFSL